MTDLDSSLGSRQTPAHAPGSAGTSARGGTAERSGTGPRGLRGLKSRGLSSRVPTPCFALASMVLLQLGIAASKPLFGPLGATGATSLRMLVAAAVLVAATRPRLRGKTPRQLAAAVLLGVVSGFMTLTFAASVARIPMGVTSTIEYLGPLVVALAGTRRALDAVWALLAAGGVALITLTAAGGAGAGGLDPVGLGFAAAAAVCWGLYLVLTKRVGTAFDGFQGLAVSISVGALTVAPIGLGRGLHGLAAAGDPAGPAAGWSWWLLLLAVAGAAMLFPVLPYALEMTALRRIQPRLLGILFSLEPAVAALIGLLVLGQALGWSQVGGMACVVGASLAATLTARVD